MIGAKQIEKMAFAVIKEKLADLRSRGKFVKTMSSILLVIQREALNSFF